MPEILQITNTNKISHSQVMIIHVATDFYITILVYYLLFRW